MERHVEWAHFEVNDVSWHVPSRYGELKPLGCGSFGYVCSARDATTNQPVAIKKLIHPFASVLHAKRLYREIKLLKHCANHENIIALVDVFTPQSARDLTDVYSQVYAFF
jgi:p38 MAP kinase